MSAAPENKPVIGHQVVNPTLKRSDMTKMKERTRHADHEAVSVESAFSILCPASALPGGARPTDSGYFALDWYICRFDHA